jgi:hypothetical protein
MNLLKEHFHVFCTYRFYNSHTKAMDLRREEIRKNLIERAAINPRRNYTMRPSDFDDNIDEPEENEHLFLSRETLKLYNGKKKRESVVLIKESIANFGWISRNNKFNEDDTNIKKVLDEDNVVVASWINDMGLDHKEYDVSF